jgi:hypothetical protein
MVPTLTPQLVANNGLRALRLAISKPKRFACEPEVDAVRGLAVYQPDGSTGSKAPSWRTGLHHIATRRA